MDGHFVEIIGAIFLFIFGMTMFYQGYMVLNQKNGYSHCNKKIESANMRRRIETLLKDK
jgi:hypothetical protein